MGEIESRFDAPLPNVAPWRNHCPSIHRDGRELCVVRLHDSWARFCRELVIQSAADRPITTTGTIVIRAPGIGRRSDVIPALRSTYTLAQQQKWYEPRWADAAACIDAAKRLQLANAATISAAIGSTPSPVEHLRRVRNFIAHRGRDTASLLIPVAASIGLKRFRYPEDIIAARIPPGMALFMTWTVRLRAIARAAVT